MEITKRDMLALKLSPSLICFLKSIHFKQNDYIETINKVADVFTMAKHLQEHKLVKIVGKELSYKSFEIRNVTIINYFDNNYNTIEQDVDEVIDYFKKVTKKGKILNSSSSNRRFIKGRLQQYSVSDLKGVIDFKYKEWVNDPLMKKYIRIETLFNETKFQGYISEVESNNNRRRTITG